MHGVHFQKNNEGSLIWIDMFKKGRLAFKTSYQLQRKTGSLDGGMALGARRVRPLSAESCSVATQTRHSNGNLTVSESPEKYAVLVRGFEG